MLLRIRAIQKFSINRFRNQYTFKNKLMPIITSADLGTNIYPEIITEITRGDTSIADAAIANAIQEAKMYLARFDITALFGTDTEPPTTIDAFLAGLVKDIACWRLIKLSNTGVDFAAYRSIYEDAINTLDKIKTGSIQPQGWAYADLSTETTPMGDSISWTSNARRHNYY